MKYGIITLSNKHYTDIIEVHKESINYMFTLLFSIVYNRYISHLLLFFIYQINNKQINIILKFKQHIYILGSRLGVNPGHILGHLVSCTGIGVI